MASVEYERDHQTTFLFIKKGSVLRQASAEYRRACSTNTVADTGDNMTLTIYNSESYTPLQLPNNYRGIKNDVFHKFITFDRVPILAPDAVENAALCEARYLLKKMFEKCEHRISDIRESNLVITILPEYPGGIFDPSLEKANLIIVNEQDLLHSKSSTFIHETAHAVHHTLAAYEKNKINTFFDTTQEYYGSAPA